MLQSVENPMGDAQNNNPKSDRHFGVAQSLMLQRAVALWCCQALRGLLLHVGTPRGYVWSDVHIIHLALRDQVLNVSLILWSCDVTFWKVRCIQGSTCKVRTCKTRP